MRIPALLHIGAQLSWTQYTVHWSTVIGLIALGALYFIDRKRGLGPKDSLLVDICALYWHFVDVVWIAIFTLVYLIQ